jgi:hypothetical protein
MDAAAIVRQQVMQKILPDPFHQKFLKGGFGGKLFPKKFSPAFPPPHLTCPQPVITYL